MMDAITEMVSQNAKISKEQSIKAIEAVLAYISHEMPNDISEAVNSKIVNSNAGSVGGRSIETILEIYTAKYGLLLEKFKM